MKKVFTAKDIAELKRSGGALPPDAILTPQAKEVLSGGAKISTSAPAPKAAAEVHDFTGIQLSWSAVEGASSYEVYRAEVQDEAAAVAE